MEKIKHFDWLAPVYEKFFSKKASQKLLQSLTLMENQLILDIGGGTGRVAQGLIGDGRKVVVADFSFQMLLEAKHKSDLCCVTCNALVLPFKNHLFDRIVMVDTLHHLFEQEISLRELWRVLKPSGLIVIEEPDISRFTVKIIALIEKVLLMKSKFLKSQELINLLKLVNPVEISEYKENNTYWIVATK